jgi:hypothetical protein
MRWCLIAFVLLPGQSVEMDVSRLTVGAPAVVAKIDLGLRASLENSVGQ